MVQHPSRVRPEFPHLLTSYKAIDTGTLSDRNDGIMRYANVDTTPQSRGAGVFDLASEKLVGIHVADRCSTGNRLGNEAIPMTRILEHSTVLKTLVSIEAFGNHTHQGSVRVICDGKSSEESGDFIDMEFGAARRCTSGGYVDFTCSTGGQSGRELEYMKIYEGDRYLRRVNCSRTNCSTSQRKGQDRLRAVCEHSD